MTKWLCRAYTVDWRVFSRSEAGRRVALQDALHLVGYGVKTRPDAERALECPTRFEFDALQNDGRAGRW